MGTKVYSFESGNQEMSGPRNSNPLIPAMPAVAGSVETAFTPRHSTPAPVVRSLGSTQERAEERLRTAINVLIALVALIVLLPVLALIGLLVRLTSQGPVVYTQERVGLDRRWRNPNVTHQRRKVDLGGKPFTIYKFRTMVQDAEQTSGAVWASPTDARVTSIGRFLRQYRLDELPQLVNVLKGEMSIVGPRPERPQIFAELRYQIADYPLRQRAKPGITGLAQISQNYDSCLDDVRAKVRFDLEYIQNQSVKEDLRIMVKTLPVLLFRRGGW